MKTQRVEYVHGGRTFIGHLAWDNTRTEKRPGVLLFPEAFGLNDHAREYAERLVQAGYVAFAADPHGDGRIHDMQSISAVIQALASDRQEWRGRAQAALHALKAQSPVDPQRVAAIGFCFGGATCLELARSGADVAAVVTFHAGLNASLPEDAGRMRAKVLICHGAEDPIVAKDSIDVLMNEFRRDKVDWQFLFNGNATHSFTDVRADSRGVASFAYSKAATARSWAAMLQLFSEAFASD